MSTRSGRVVKAKYKTDADIVTNNAGSLGKLTKSPTTQTTKKSVSPRSLLEEKSRKISTPKTQQNIIKEGVDIRSPALSSQNRNKSVNLGKNAQVSTDNKSAPVNAQSSDDSVENKLGAILSPQTERDVSKETSTPSTVRRSGRASVPSSRYKDMELDLGRIKRRSYTAADGDVESQPAKKIRKVNDKSAPNKEDVVNKLAHPATNDETSEVQSVAVVLVDSNASFTLEDMIQNNLPGTDAQAEGESISTESSSIQIPVVSGQPLHKVNSVASNTQDRDLYEGTAEEVTPAFPSIETSDQQLTFSEKDGETLAVTTVPVSTLKTEVVHEQNITESSYQDQGIPVEILDDDKGKRAMTNLVTVSPAVHTLVHGHVLKKELQENPFATVVGQDGATYLNLTVEATKISSILKTKNVATATKSLNPLKGHGRVLRNPAGSMIVKTSLAPPRNSQETPLIVPAVTYSLIHPKISEVDDSAMSVQNTVALPLSVQSQQTNQSTHKVVVIKQQTPQIRATSLTDISQATPHHSADSTLAVLHYSHDDVTAVPKTASEILLQRLKQQPKAVVVKDSAHASQDGEQKSVPNVDGNDAEMVHVDEPETSAQQIVSQNSDHIGISQCEIDEVVESSSPETHSEVRCETAETCVENISGNNLSAVSGDNDSSLSKEVNAKFVVGESSHAISGDVAALCGEVSLPRQQVDNDTPEGDCTASTSDDSQSPESCTSLTVLKNAEQKDVKSDNPAEDQASTEPGSADQDTCNKIVNIRKTNNKIVASAGGKDKGRFEKIRIVDNGVAYDVRIVSEEEVTEEIIDNAASQLLQSEPKQSDENSAETEIVVKEEINDAEDIKQEVEKQTSSTQTVYSPQAQSMAGQAEAVTRTTHTMATVIDEGPDKKHVYYVSVIPNKGIMTKTKTSMYSNAASWVIDSNGMFCCEKCDYQTDRKANFYKHRRSHTGSKPHVCPVCQYKAGTSSNLKRHMGIHKDIREHKCDICSLCFRQKIHLERHIKYKHEEKSIKCPMCDYICANEQPDLKMHIKRKHSTENSGEMVTCPECKVQVGNKKDLKQHMKFHKEGPELKLFCKECSFVTDCQSRLKRHTAIHSKMKPFQCGVCSYRAAQKEHVLRHLRTQHKIDIKRDGKRPWRRHKKITTDDGLKERSDFTSGDKIFACNHCTMRFAKLINLYKHLHTQHGDIMPAESDGNFYCVVCEFSTTNKKNLLVHMRRHNMTDQTPPTHVYSCVLCRYVNPRRRNLFQHMRKKHNINISRQTENAEGDEDGEEGELEVAGILGSVSRVLTPSNSNTISGTTDTSQNSSREMSEELTDVASVIKIEDLTRMANGEQDDMQALVIDSRGTGATEVIHTTTHTVEALEGLQALAEQAGLVDSSTDEQVPVIDEQQAVIFEQNGSAAAEIEGTVDAAGGHFEHVIQSAEVLSGASGEPAEGLELSEEQLSSLRNGDMVEMDGHLYLVELTQVPNNPHKQMLSFLPVSTTSISQDTQS